MNPELVPGLEVGPLRIPKWTCHCFRSCGGSKKTAVLPSSSQARQYSLTCPSPGRGQTLPSPAGRCTDSTRSGSGRDPARDRMDRTRDGARTSRRAWTLDAPAAVSHTRNHGSTRIKKWRMRRRPESRATHPRLKHAFHVSEHYVVLYALRHADHAEGVL